MLAGCASIGGGGDDDGEADPQGTPDAGDTGGDDVDDELSERIDIEVSGLVQWTDTGIDVGLGEHLSVTATGMVAHGGGGEYGPAGDPALANFAANIVNCVGHVALIGRVGALGDAFYLGPEASFAATTADRLYLGVNDLGVDNNGGAFATEVTTNLDHESVSTRSLSVPGTTAWTDTGVDVALGQQLTITASGTVIHATATGDGCDPTGEPATAGHGANVIGCPNHGSLIGKIGAAGAPFYVGRTYSVPSAATGRLFLGVNDIDLTNNGGSYAASVAVTAR